MAENREVVKDRMVAMRKPEWLRIKKSGFHDLSISTARVIHDLNLHTVCESAQCPNKGECFNNRTATFMILGDICTRNCTFCAVSKDRNRLQNPDVNEPQRIADAVKELQLDYIVLTMVTRDDLVDGGTDHLIKVIKTIRSRYKTDAEIEVLVSDLKGECLLIKDILDIKPTVFNHNVETIARLYPQIRPEADYQRSLRILEFAKEYAPDIPTKSGFMVGLGETDEEIISLMQDLRAAEVNILTIGQYLAPSAKHHPVIEFIHPERFKVFRQKALEMGFNECFSGPFVRSSYKAKDALFLKKNNLNQKRGSYHANNINR